MVTTVVGRFKRRAPKNAQSRRALKKMESKVFENPKSCLFLRGANTSTVVVDAMTDLRKLLGSRAKILKKRNAFHPFEGQEHLEFLGHKNDCSLFCFGSDSKKRPHNLVIGRQFDFQVLDMVEFGIVGQDRFDMSDAKGLNCCSMGSKPAFFFEGSEWETDDFFSRLKNLIVDFFGGYVATKLVLSGVDRAIGVTLRSTNGEDAVVAPSSDCARASVPQAVKGNAVLCFRHYGLVQTRTSTGELTDAKQVKLVDVGPNLDLEIRRVFFAPAADFKKACKVPRAALAYEKHLQGNVKTDALGNLRGQIHMGKQDLNDLALRRFKAQKKRGRAHADHAAAAAGGDDGAGDDDAPAAAMDGDGFEGANVRVGRGGDAKKRRRKTKANASDGIAYDVEVDI